MKFMLKLALGLAAVTATAGAANADLISIGFSTTTTPPPVAAVSNTPGAVFAGSVAGTGGAFSVTVSGSTESFPGVFQSMNLTTSGLGTLFIWVTDSNITTPVGDPFLTTFVLNSGIRKGSGTIFTEQAWLDPANGIFTTVDPLGTANFFATATTAAAVGATQSQLTSVASGGNYSVTERFEIQFPRSSNVSGSIDVSVPGPVVGAGLPGLLAACGGLVALARRRRRVAA
jgi:hypothetical protein